MNNVLFWRSWIKKTRCHNKKHNVTILHKHQQDIDIFPRGIRRIFLLFPSTKGLLRTVYIWDTKRARCLTYFPSLLVILLKHLTEVAWWKKHLFAFQQNWSTCVVCTYTCITITPKPFWAIDLSTHSRTNSSESNFQNAFVSLTSHFLGGQYSCESCGNNLRLEWK